MIQSRFTDLSGEGDAPARHEGHDGRRVAALLVDDELGPVPPAAKMGRVETFENSNIFDYSMDPPLAQRGAVDEQALDHVPRLLEDVVLVAAQELVREGHAQLVGARRERHHGPLVEVALEVLLERSRWRAMNRCSLSYSVASSSRPFTCRVATDEEAAAVPAHISSWKLLHFPGN